MLLFIPKQGRILPALCETILDIALGRAADGNQIDAIGTAQLVPEDDPSAYVRAQQLIEQWKIQISSQQQKD